MILMDLEALINMIPPLSPEEYGILKASIKHSDGPIYPVIKNERGIVIDGRNRQKICKELGLECPEEQREFGSDAEAAQFAYGLNFQRRHLSKEQRRAMIVALAEVDVNGARLSLRQVAQMTGVSYQTVSNYLQDAGVKNLTPDEGGAEIISGMDGKTYKRKLKAGEVDPDEDPDDDDEPLPDFSEAELEHQKRLKEPRRYDPQHGQEMVEQSSKAIALKEEGLPNTKIAEQLGVKPREVTELVSVAHMPQEVQDLIKVGHIGGKVIDALGRLYGKDVKPEIDPELVTLLARKFALGALPNGGGKQLIDGTMSAGAPDAVALTLRIHEGIAEGVSFYKRLRKQWLVTTPEMSLDDALYEESWHVDEQARKAQAAAEAADLSEEATNLYDQLRSVTFGLLPTVETFLTKELDKDSRGKLLNVLHELSTRSAALVAGPDTEGENNATGSEG